MIKIHNTIKNKRTIFNKKGQYELARKMIFWPIIGVVVITITFFVAFMFANYNNALASVPNEFQVESLLPRFIDKGDCFAYVDPVTQKAEFQSIDIEKFNVERANKCYIPQENEKRDVPGLEFYLPAFEKKVMTSNYYNHIDYTLYEVVEVIDQGKRNTTQLIVYVQKDIR